MGRVKKGEKCSVKGCAMDAIRSLSVNKVKNVGLDVESSKRAYLCKEHYKEYKKGNKKLDQIERWRHGIA